MLHINYISVKQNKKVFYFNIGALFERDIYGDKIHTEKYTALQCIAQ